MYKDFKQSESLDTGFVGGSGLIWMFSGIILGLLVGLGMYYFANNKAPVLSSIDSVQQKIASAQLSGKTLKQPSNSLTLRKSTTTSDSRANNLSTAKRTNAAGGKREERRNNFSYYAVLPTLDVPVGAPRVVKAVNDNSANEEIAEKIALLDVEDIQQQPIATSDGGFLLQVASFKRKDRANKTIKRLNKKGISAYIQAKNVKGRTWYRVVAGPIGSDGADNWKLTAEKLGHRPMIISVR